MACASCPALQARIETLERENAQLRQALAQHEQPPLPQTAVEPSPTDDACSPWSRAELQRYGRQMLVPDFGSDAQLRLKHARVLLIGAGGLGSAVALYLGAMGVGTLGIVDDDRVERSNLHRQVLHDETSVGEFKAVSAHKRLARLNPHVDCMAHVTRFIQRNALELVQQYDVVVDASDNVATRYLANAACAKLRKPLVSGSALGLEGQLSVFTYEGSSSSCCYQCLYPRPLAAPMTCAENGVLGVVPGIIGCLQAVEACKLITHVGVPLVGVQCLYDAYDGQFRRLKIGGARRDPDCPACGDQASWTGNPVLMATTMATCSADISGQLEEKHRISIEAFAALRRVARQNPDNQDAKYLLLDTRSDTQFGMMRFPEAVQIPFHTLLKLSDPIQALQNLYAQQKAGGARQKPIQEMQCLVICRRGVDSIAATEFLLGHGLRRVQNVEGGYTLYARDVDPLFPMY